MSKLTIFILCTACFLGAGCDKAAPPTVAKAVDATPTLAPAITPPPAAQNVSQTPAAADFDACSLLTKEEVSEVAGSPIKDTKSNQRSSEAMTTAQCFYTAEEFSRSINVTLMLRNPRATGGRSPRDVWRESFAKFSDPENRELEEREREGREREDGDSAQRGGRESEEREKESKPPRRVDGLGEEAFWTSGIGSTLYVLKGESFIRIGIGSAGKDDERLNRAKALAAKALERF